MTTSISIAEGRILRAQKNQEIDYHHLNSCFTLTAHLANGEKVGAHFALKGEEAGGRNPKDLLFMFSKVIEQAHKQKNPPVSVNLVGFLCYWYPSTLGIKLRSESTLSESSSQKAIAESLQVSVDKIQVQDTSFKERVYLTIAADGAVIFKEKDDGKDKK